MSWYIHFETCFLYIFFPQFCWHYRSSSFIFDWFVVFHWINVLELVISSIDKHLCFSFLSIINSASWNPCISLQATYQSFSRSYTWLSNCLVLEYTFFLPGVYRILTISICPSLPIVGVVRSLWIFPIWLVWHGISFVFCVYFIFHSWVFLPSLQDLPQTYPSHIFYWTFCYYWRVLLIYSR